MAAESSYASVHIRGNSSLHSVSPVYIVCHLFGNDGFAMWQVIVDIRKQRWHQYSLDGVD